MDKGLVGVGIFSLGGVGLIYVIYSTLENVGKPWINQSLLLGYLILPVGLLAFLLLGYGLLLITRSRVEQAQR